MRRERAASATAPPAVTIAREYQRLYLDRPCDEVLEFLATIRHVLRDDGKYGHRVHRMTEPLWECYIRLGPSSCLAGLEPALILPPTNHSRDRCPSKGGHETASSLPTRTHGVWLVTPDAGFFQETIAWKGIRQPCPAATDSHANMDQLPRFGRGMNSCT
ncbi:hypothetical protein V5E97_11470 [Singulisphaera sp. Ch08]|uniref:Uncharacterized protein n=1 Tax=Singulisphaera sp. Ch08 TaxID=3120278 RepID=A0AAU7CNB1_9BACT